MHFISVDIEMLPVYLGETEKTIPDKQFLPHPTDGHTAHQLTVANKQWGLLLLNICSFAPTLHCSKSRNFQTYLRV